MQTRPDKVIYRYKSNLNLSVLSDPDDLKFFQVAIASPHKIIISEDSDLTNIAASSEIEDLGISIWELDQALANL